MKEELVKTMRFEEKILMSVHFSRHHSERLNTSQVVWTLDLRSDGGQPIDLVTLLMRPSNACSKSRYRDAPA